MHDANALLRGLKARGLVPAAPRLSAWSRRRAVVAVGAVALAAGALWFVQPTHLEPVSSRGEAAPLALQTLDLRVAIERDGRTLRMADGGTAHVGEQVYFRARAQAPGSLTLRVAGPDGEQVVSRVEAGPEGVDVRSDDGLLAWRFTTAGRHVFTLEEPASGASSTLAVEVR